MSRAAAEALFGGPVERIVRRTRRRGSIHDRVDRLDLPAMAARVDELMSFARHLHIQNSERDHEMKDELIKGLAAIKRQLEGK